MCDAHSHVFDLDDQPSTPTGAVVQRLSRRAALLGATAALVGGLTAITHGRQRTSAAAPTGPEPTGPQPTGPQPTGPQRVEAASVAPLASAGSVTGRARRLKQVGSIPFPMGPAPRCFILDNFGDPRGGRRHEGVDLLATLGQEVYAVADGVLTDQTDASSALAGNSWGLVASTGEYYFYAHLSAFASGLVKGATVRRGDLIGFVGDTGNPGPGNYHLHFEVHPGGRRSPAVDPLPLLAIPGACTVYWK
jgi:murein DD-endopeptidase MepM/ murein hydrolase activator NlpD